MATTWEDRAADKRSRIEKSVPSEWKIKTLPTEDSVFDFPDKSGLLSSTELEITKSSATDLVVKLAKGELKSVDVTLAFSKRAALAHQLVGCTVSDGVFALLRERHVPDGQYRSTVH